MAEIDRAEVFESVADLRLAIPVLGLLFYSLAVISLWFFDPSEWAGSDLDGIDIGAMPDS